MVDANAKIRVDLDLAEALAQLKTLERQIQLFNKSIVQGSSSAAKAQGDFTTSLIHNINATGKFTASMGKIHTETERFTNALEKNKLSAREYFRYSMASTKTFGRLFGKEFGTITKVAEERVKQLQARHIELGRAADGAMRSVRVVPKSLDYSKPITQLQILAQKQQIFNKLLDAGTTKLLNFGKNTQWAGRQLMVGFTIPLSILGSTALRTFRDMETQALRFKKVYGDLFTTTTETTAALDNIKKLANEFTKYGVAVADTIKLAADAAAAGNAGDQLESVVKQATKLSVLGGVAQDQALEATIAIQNAFGVTGKALDESINFLNAVENQTVVALDDITEAIPKVAPVIRQLGGDIKDLAFFMAAMQEGGVKASEAANALKSGLASLINPSKAASEMAAQLGINLTAIVEQNAGDLRATVLTFAEALKPLDELSKARLIEQIFGKYQFARISTLFENVGKSGTQAARVLDLTNKSAEALALTADKELGVTANSAATKFTAAVEKLKVALVPLGEQFAKVLTPVADFLTKLLEKFNGLSDGTKTAITIVLAAIGGLGPVVLMSIGLISNGLANIGKGINLLRKGYQSLVFGTNELGISTNYLTTEQLEQLSISNNLHSAHASLTSQFALESAALLELTSVYKQAAAAASTFATANPGLFVPGTASRLKKPKFGKPMAEGGWVPGTGNKDSVPTVLMPGEFVVTKKAAQSNKEVLERMNKGGQTYRTKGTPAFGKMAYRANPTGPGYTPQADRLESRDWAHVDVKQAMPKSLIDELLKDEASLTNSTKSRLKIASLDKRLNESDLRKFASDLKVDNYKNLTKNELEDAIKQKTGASTIRQAREVFSKSLYAYTSEVTDLSKSVQSGMTARGSKSKGTTTVGQLIDDISRNRYTFAAGLYEGILKDRKDLTQKQKVAIMRSVAKKTERSLVVNFGRKHVIGEDEYTKIYRDAEDKALDEKLGKDSKLRKEIKDRVNEQRKNITTLSYAGSDRGAIFSKEVAMQKGALSYIQFEKLKNLRPKILTSLGKIDKVRRFIEPKISKVKGMPVVGSSKFGPAMAIATVGSLAFGAAAQAQGRAKGTPPRYGEQGVTPAMLTPGEFVMNAQSAQANGPELQAMNMGGVAFRSVNPNIDGYIPDPSNIPDEKSQQWTEKFNESLRKQGADPQGSLTAEQIRKAGNYADERVPGVRPQTTETRIRRGVRSAVSGAARGASRIGSAIASKANSRGLQGAIKENTAALDQSTKASTTVAENTDETNKANKALGKDRAVKAANAASMLSFAIGGGAMALGMKAQDEETRARMEKIQTTAFTIGAFAGALPLLMSTTGLLVGSFAALAAATFLYNKQINDSRKKGYEFGQQLSITSKELDAVFESTGKPSATAIQESKRRSRISPLNLTDTEFGETYLGSTAGQQLTNLIKTIRKDQEKNAPQIIATRLANYVSQGLMSAAEASSVAEAIGKQLNSETFALNISGKLTQLIGPNGSDLVKDPLKVQIRLIEEQKNQAQTFFNSLPTEIEKAQEKTAVNFQNIAFGTGVAALGAGAGALVGAFTGAKIGAAVGTAGGPIGAIVGTIAGALIGTATAVFIKRLSKNKDLAKLGGISAGISTAILTQTQQSLDSFREIYQTRLQQLDAEQLLLESQLKATTNSEKRRDIEKELNTILILRKRTEDQYAVGQEELINNQISAYSMLRKQFLDNPEIQGEINKSLAESVIKKGQEQGSEAFAKLLDQQSKNITKTVTRVSTSGPGYTPIKFEERVAAPEIRFTLLTAVDTGAFSLDNALMLLDMYKDSKTGKIKGEEIQKQFDFYVNVVGYEGFNRIATLASQIEDASKRETFLDRMQLATRDPEYFEKTTKFLEMAASAAKDLGVNFEDFTELPVESLAQAGASLQEIEKLPDVIKKEAFIEFITSDSDFNKLEEYWDWFDGIPDNQVKQALQVYTVAYERLDKDLSGIEARALEENLSGARYAAMAGQKVGTITPSQQQKKDRQQREAMAEVIALYNRQGGFTVPGGEEGADTSGAGSLPITTEQLIELRLKGLDPAATSQLDFASAAKILSGSVKKQKQDISTLNASMRDNAIRAELLKTEQEALADSLDEVSNSIGAYLDVIEQTQVKPIQNQIDKYNELTNAQQTQVELYQRGLQQLSDREDKINNIYDQRIQAIDKVTQANERAAQAQKRQIDLATALTSGDIAAAASAAADITSAGAQAQLEDTRSALEQQRQAEINALTTEINNKLYTRTQIETNIKTIEEEIYQRSLLIRQEQEKIANIEKTITAEKEKQRKLQVLSQIAGISERMQTTVNQTARQAMGAQIGYLGQSIGLDINNPQQVAELGKQLGVNLNSINTSIATANTISQLTADEFTDKFLKVKNKLGDISKFFDEGTSQARLSLSYLSSLKTTWEGTTKVAGMKSTGLDILRTLTTTANSIRTGKEQIQNAVNAGVAAIKNAKPNLKYDPKTGKMVPVAFGGMMGKGKLTGYMYGGNVNYKGSREPAPVRMAMGSIVPGLGNTDRIPALLTPGEFVVRKSVAQENMGLLKSLNGDVFPQINSSGAPSVDASSTNIKSNILNNSPVYNYSVNVNVPNTNASPDEIANAVITKINRYQNNRVRGSRV